MNNPYTNDYTIRLADRRLDGHRLSGIAGALFHAWLRFRWWRIETRAIRHLESLEQDLLDDIGIERWQIPAAVHGRLQQRSVSRSCTECGTNDVRQHLAA